MEQNDYMRYRGKCKEMSEALVAADPTLALVRGHYYDFQWGAQQHWWCKRPDGTIVDPTKDQFPSHGLGIYTEFDGTIPCEYCEKSVTEQTAHMNGHHVYCSYECGYKDVMG